MSALQASVRPRPEWAAAFLLGVGAGGMLFAATVGAARAASGPPAEVLASVQAAGVFLGAFTGARRRSGGHGPLAGALCAAAAAAAALWAPHAGDWLLMGSALVVGLAVGTGVAAADGLAAAAARQAARASTVVGVGLFGACGAALAPVLAQASDVLGTGPYLPAAAAFALAAVLWTRLWAVRGAVGGPPVAAMPAGGPSPEGLLAMLGLPFLFGVVDNGVLALAPADVVARGADGWAASGVGFAAAAGAAAVQLAAVLRLEAGAAPRRLVQAGLVVLVASLALLAVTDDPARAAALLFCTGVGADLMYGAALVLCLNGLPVRAVAGAIGLIVAACALGEVVGPLALGAAQAAAGRGGAIAGVMALAVCAHLAATSRREPSHA